jgi:FtsP/CotA-like multicopper oxidase with cupredoxin domain
MNNPITSFSPSSGAPMSRRRFMTLAAGAAGALVVARPTLAAAAIPEQTSGVPLTAGRATVDLAGTAIKTWAYNGQVPGPILRVRAGDTLRARLVNQLADDTTIHWHGIALANPMDGVPGVTQPPVARGNSFDYEFVTPHPGTYFFHPHVGLQLDHGLYAPLIVDDPAEPGAYDTEWIVVLDDWTDGVGSSPTRILNRLRNGGAMDMESDSGMDMEGHDMSGSSDSSMSDMGSMRSKALGGHAGDVEYPLYLINGKPPKDPETFQAKAGQKIRLRIINAGSDTAFRFAVGGHRLTITHADGFAVERFETDAVLLGMGERIDAIVTCQGDVNPVVARAEGKGADARAVLRAGTGSISSWRVPELKKQLATVADLTPAPAAMLSSRVPDRTHRLVLGGNDMDYQWTINRKTYDTARSFPISAGERVRLTFRNDSTMWHPMHLHGHTFAVVASGMPMVRKDTVIVKPNDTMSVDFDADNPGAWMLHCHNIYHQESGMMTTLTYA